MRKRAKWAAIPAAGLALLAWMQFTGPSADALGLKAQIELPILDEIEAEVELPILDDLEADLDVDLDILEPLSAGGLGIDLEVELDD